MLKSLFAASALLLSGIAACAAPAAKPAAPAAKPAAHASAAALVCPVTHEKIASAAKAYSKEVYQGKTYYFCCPDCKPQFDKNPAAYVKSASVGTAKPSRKM